MPDQPAPRRSLFTVWRRPWWAWVLMAMLTPVAYFLSEPPVMATILSTGPV